MKTRTASASVLLVCATVVLLSQAAGGATSPKVWLGEHAKLEEMLRTAEVVSIEDVGMGVTKPRKATLKMGDQTYHAAFKPIQRGRHKGFWESYQAEIAAYEIDKLVGLDMVPPTVKRRIKGQTGSLQFWVDDCHLYAEVQAQTPHTTEWSHQLSRMKMFDVLIHNADRNAQNFLVDPDFQIILIDHSRAFISGDKMLKQESKLPVQFDRKLVENVRNLTRESLDAHMEGLLLGGQIKDILKRRDKLLDHLDKLIEERGEARVLF